VAIRSTSRHAKLESTEYGNADFTLTGKFKESKFPKALEHLSPAFQSHTPHQRSRKRRPRIQYRLKSKDRI